MLLHLSGDHLYFGVCGEILRIADKQKGLKEKISCVRMTLKRTEAEWDEHFSSGLQHCLVCSLAYSGVFRFETNDVRVSFKRSGLK